MRTGDLFLRDVPRHSLCRLRCGCVVSHNGERHQVEHHRGVGVSSFYRVDVATRCGDDPMCQISRSYDGFVNIYAVVSYDPVMSVIA